MAIAVMIVRILLGLILIFASAAYFLDLAPQPELEGDMVVFSAGLPVALFVVLANLFLVYACRQHYRALFSRKIQRIHAPA
jgi:hypothetical protein